VGNKKVRSKSRIPCPKGKGFLSSFRLEASFLLPQAGFFSLKKKGLLGLGVHVGILKM